MSKILATPAARRIAKEKKIELINIVPSSRDGILRQKDLIAFNQVFTQKVTPLAYKMAKVNKVDLAEVEGSGYNGKILKADVLKLMGQGNKDVTTDHVIPTPSQSTKTENVDVKVVKKSDHHVSPMTVVQEGDGSRRVAMTPMRKVIARRMTESYFEVPAVHIDNEVDMTKLLDLRQELIPTIEEETGYRVSVGDLISMATVKSLMKHPAVNASIDLEKQEIIYHDYVNLAIAVGLENGLLTPVINQADQLSLKQYVTAAKPLFKAATEGKLSADQLQGSTFTISNLGMFDTDSFTPIINLPNAAILGVNATKKKVVVVDEEMVIRPIMKLSLTMDHRVLDGMEGAKFLQTLKGYLENPLSLIV
jgi:pyruvate dehydrogenase E2 component (dihydrolipoamide acetyltransferase)